MKEFSKEWFAALREDLGHALEPIGKRYGFDFSIANISYDTNTFSAKLTALRKATDTFDPKKAAWDTYAVRYGLLPEHFGATFLMNEKPYTIVGINPTAKRNNIIVQTAIGGEYVMPPAAVKEKLGLLKEEDVEQKMQQTWDTMAFMLGVKGVPYKQVFTNNGKRYEALDLSPRAKKYPVVARDITTGVSYKFPIDVLLPFKPTT